MTDDGQYKASHLGKWLENELEREHGENDFVPGSEEDYAYRCGLALSRQEYQRQIRHENTKEKRMDEQKYETKQAKDLKVNDLMPYEDDIFGTMIHRILNIDRGSDGWIDIYILPDGCQQGALTDVRYHQNAQIAIVAPPHEPGTWLWADQQMDEGKWICRGGGGHPIRKRPDGQYEQGMGNNWALIGPCISEYSQGYTSWRLYEGELPEDEPEAEVEPSVVSDVVKLNASELVIGDNVEHVSAWWMVTGAWLHNPNLDNPNIGWDVSVESPTDRFNIDTIFVPDGQKIRTIRPKEAETRMVKGEDLAKGDVIWYEDEWRTVMDEPSLGKDLVSMKMLPVVDEWPVACILAGASYKCKDPEISLRKSNRALPALSFAHLLRMI